MDLEWTYALGNVNKTKSDVNETSTSDLNANVAVDLFLDSDITKAQNSTAAAMEIMVWFAAIGGAAKPVGNGVAPAHTAQLDGYDL